MANDMPASHVQNGEMTADKCQTQRTWTSCPILSVVRCHPVAKQKHPPLAARFDARQTAGAEKHRMESDARKCNTNPRSGFRVCAGVRFNEWRPYGQ
jgi:hypothetical protein